MAETTEDKPNRLVKNLKVSLRTHKEIAHASTDTGKKMFELIDEAWECWKRAQAGTPSSGSSKVVPAIDAPASQHHNAQVEKLKRLEESKLEIIDKLGRIVTEEAGILREIEANPRSRGRGDSPGRRARGGG